MKQKLTVNPDTVDKQPALRTSVTLNSSILSIYKGCDFEFISVVTQNTFYVLYRNVQHIFLCTFPNDHGNYKLKISNSQVGSEHGSLLSHYSACRMLLGTYLLMLPF